jgi:hypothetical protein
MVSHPLHHADHGDRLVMGCLLLVAQIGIDTCLVRGYMAACVIDRNGRVGNVEKAGNTVQIHYTW